MKEKKTIQQKLSMRKVKTPNKFIWFLLSKLIVPILAHKFHPSYVIKDDINRVKGAKFLVFNHQSRMDYLWAVQMSYPTTLNFVIGYNEFFRSKFSFLFNLLHFIPKKNFTTDIPSIKQMNSILKQGGTVCFSPEGMSSIAGGSQPIVPGTGKFFKHYGVPVFVSKSRGAFLCSHKVCLDERPGKVGAELFCLFTPEQLNELSEKEIEDKLNEALWNDDFEWNKSKHYKYKTFGRVTSHYEDLMYRCPKCGAELQMHTHDNIIECKACGNGIEVDDYYDLHPLHEGDVVPATPSMWVNEERREEYLRIKNDPNYSLSCDVELRELPKYKLIKSNDTGIPCGNGIVTINHDGFHFNGTRHGEPFDFTLTYDKFWTLVIVTDCTFTGLYVDGEYLEIHPNKPIIGKMLLMVEEFSRFHYNVWPNFPWMDWIYKENE